MRCAGPVIGDRAVRPGESAIRRDLLDTRPTDAEVRDGPRRPRHGVPEGIGDAGDGELAKRDVADGPGSALLIEDPLRRRVHDRGVVLVDGRHEDALPIRARDRGEAVAPGVVGLATDLAPVDRDQHHGLVERATGQDEADRLEGVDDAAGRRDPATHARMPDRDRHVGRERDQGPQAVGRFGGAIRRLHHLPMVSRERRERLPSVSTDGVTANASARSVRNDPGTNARQIRVIR